MTEAYKISTAPATEMARCATPVMVGADKWQPCGHIVAAHGSNGKICCRCACRQFTAPADTALEVTGTVLQ